MLSRRTAATCNMCSRCPLCKLYTLIFAQYHEACREEATARWWLHTREGGACYAWLVFLFQNRVKKQGRCHQGRYLPSGAEAGLHISESAGNPCRSPVLAFWRSEAWRFISVFPCCPWSVSDVQMKTVSVTSLYFRPNFQKHWSMRQRRKALSHSSMPFACVCVHYVHF